jgi:uncharacterized repeat protein (TIGR03803 family)
MKFKKLNVWFIVPVIFLLMGFSAHALEPQTLFNFIVGPGTVTGTLVQGPDGNFYGTTQHGGPTGNGTVFRVTPAGVLTILVSDQFNPAAGLVVGNDGLLYGMTGASGAFGFGTAFKMTTDGVFTNFAVFDGVNAGNPQAGLVLAGDGNFYGVSQEGGADSLGNAFRITPGGVVTSLVSFDFSDVLGGFPIDPLTLGADGNLYGMTTGGGGTGRGTVFKLTTGGTFTTIYSFQAADGFTRKARLTLGPDGNLYGASVDGGTADLGTVFRISTNGVFTNLFSFAGANGESPVGQLAFGPDGQLYGTTQLGGSAASAGTIFKVSTNGALTTLVTFSNPVSGVPQAGLLLASDGNFYGCTASAVFKMTPAGALTAIAPLISPSGVNPQGGLILAADGNFYGTARNGGANNQGTIFRLTPNGGLTPLFSFSGTNGAEPQAALAIGLDGNFYGTTQLGGSNNFGTIYRFSTNGALTSLVSFNGANGEDPQCQLVMDSVGNFYGTAPEQGPAQGGTIFRVTPNGLLTTLLAFNNTNGSFPEDGLTAGNDGNFYGTTTDGGIFRMGTVFKVTPAGVLTTLHSFDNTNGSFPLGGLVLGRDGILYGTASFGGTNLSFGTIFKITTNGAFTTLFNFHFADGSEPAVKMIQGNDGNLYGTTAFGGATVNDPSGSGLGTVFRITTNGVFTPLILFQGTNGSSPQSTLLFGNDGNLYGNTVQGGPGGGGTFFKIVTASQFSGITKAPGGMVLTGTGLPGESYHLYGTTNILVPFASWPLLTSSLLDTNGQFSYTDTGTTNLNQRFYRISTP